MRWRSFVPGRTRSVPGGSDAHSHAQTQTLTVFIRSSIRAPCLTLVCARARNPSPPKRSRIHPWSLRCFQLFFLGVLPLFGARSGPPAASTWGFTACCVCGPISQRIYITSSHIKSTARYFILCEFNCNFTP